MKVQTDPSQAVSCRFPDARLPLSAYDKDVTENINSPNCLGFHDSNTIRELPNGTLGTMVENASHNKWNDLNIQDELTVVSDDRASSEVCPEYASSDDDDDLNYEVQQAYRIFHDFLLEKHKAITAPFWNPVSKQDHSVGDSEQQGMCLRSINEKFVMREYDNITDFVADFRLMLENCYRFHGVDHWISRQAQKMEIILEQKLTLLSRALREKTSLAVTSKGRFGTEDDKGLVGSSSRRRSVPRSLLSATLGGSESIMVQALRLEEQQKAKEEKRQREQEKKEAEEASAKEVVEWEQTVLSQASPWPVDTLWELPAIGHFLCLAQTALNLPEIVFFELERCLLMPRCSTFLAKVMTSLLSQPNRRAALHRRPSLTYRRWEAELRHRVLSWYHAVGQSENQVACAEQLGLCNQFFQVVGETSPLEDKAFHLLPFNQRVWLLKGLCDNVYETQKEVQDAVLGQPIHECRESILGYDSHDNAYIHFPHFCGADLRIYCQSPYKAPDAPPPPISVRKVNSNTPNKTTLGSDDMMVSDVVEEKCDFEKQMGICLSERGEEQITSHEEMNGTGTCKGERDQTSHSTFLFSSRTDTSGSWAIKEEAGSVANRLQLKRDGESSSKSDSQLQVENFRLLTQSTTDFQDGLLKTGNASSRANLLPEREQNTCPQCFKTVGINSKYAICTCSETQIAPLTSRHNEQTNQQKHTKTKRKKKTIKKLRTKEYQGEASSLKIGQVKNTLRKATSTIKKKDKRKKRKIGKKLESRNIREAKKKEHLSLPLEPTFKLVCTSLEELRELISKTEDEMDELESTKKKSVRWQHRREAVKELHITLIRLLNELSPWEPKLIKAFQKNRARLKKDFDDFKKHPEYDIFVREELLVEEEEDFRPRKCINSPVNSPRETEENDKEEKLGDTEADGPQLLDTKTSLHKVRREVLSLTEYLPSIQGSKRLSCSIEEDQNQRKKIKLGTEDFAIFCNKIEEGPKNDSLTILNHHFPETNSALNIPMAVGHSHTPIQALLAKSVGNKVTLIRQTPAMGIHLLSPDETKVPRLTQSSKLTQPPQIELPKSSPSIRPPTSTTAPKSPLQIVHKLPGRLGLISRDCSPMKFTVQPMMDQKHDEELMRNMHIKQSEKCDSNEQQENPVCKMSFTNTPGFSVPVQHVAPLKDSQKKQISPSPPVSVNLPTPSTLTLHANKPLNVTVHDTNLNKSCLGSSADPSASESGDVRQELKTVCIRDSQSILVTTRGGNTGVVKVQTNETPGTSAVNPVFTLSPQFKALLMPPTSSSSVAVPSSTELVTTTTVSQHSNVKFTSCRANPASCPNKTTPNAISTNRLLPAISQASVSMSTSEETLQITQNQCTTKAHAENRVPERVPLKKIFLVAASTGGLSNTITTTPSTVTSLSQGSSLMFISQQSVPPRSSVTIPNRTAFPESITTESTAFLKGEPMNPTVNNTDGSSVLNEAPALSHRLHTQLSTNYGAPVNKVGIPEVSTKSFPDCVSRAGATGSSIVFVQSASSSTSEANAERKAQSDLSRGPPLLMTAGHLLSSEHSPPRLKDAPPFSVPLSVPNLCRTTAHNSNTVSSAVVTASTVNVKVKDQGLVDRTHFPTPVSVQSAFKSLPGIPFRVVPPLSVGRSTAVQTASSSASPTTSSIRPFTEPKSTTTTPKQEKIVINSTAPLAPGTQIIINNARFVVPAQGLGPGSHVLLISRPLSASEPQQSGTITKALPPGAARVPVPTPVLPSLQGNRVVNSGTKSHHAVIKLPIPTAVKVGLGSVPVAFCPPATPVRPPPSSSSSCNPQISHLLGAATTTGKQNMSSFLKFPSLLTSEGNLSNATSIQVLTNSVAHMSTAPSPLKGSPSAPIKSGSLYAAPVSTTPKPQRVSVVAPFGTVASLPSTVTMPFVNSSTSRMQAMPVATVRPIGSTLNNRQTTPTTTTVSPSNTTVIMAPCQPLNNKATPKSVPIPVVLANTSQMERKASLQISSPSMLTGLSHNRLMVSPDGAILNTIRDHTFATIHTVPTASDLTLSTSGALGQPAQKIMKQLKLTQTTQEGPNR